MTVRTCKHPNCDNELVGKANREWCSSRCRNDAKRRERFWGFFSSVRSELAERRAQRARERATA